MNKLTLTGSCLSFLTLTVLLCTHLSTYKVQLSNLSSQADIQSSVQQKGAPPNTKETIRPTQTPNTTSNTNTTYTVVAAPTLTITFINQVLAAHGSPAAGTGQALYNLGMQYGIDPAFALAFFQHESSFGTVGEATTTLSLGNLRCYTGAICIDQQRGGYAKYASWQDGFTAWYALIRTYYINQRGLTTIDQIIPVYAPTADNNDQTAYITALKDEINGWHAGNIHA